MSTSETIPFSVILPPMDRFERAATAFDRANGADPTLVRDADHDGEERPRELVQAERLARWVERLAPEASEALRLAARCQHIRRWEKPRASYPPGRIGYLEWRKALSNFHADCASAILKDAGYDEATIEHVRRINQKKSIKQDAEVQIMEDALCLAFLEYEVDDFAAKHPPEKIIEILQKTWKKMSDRGHAVALALPLSENVLGLVQRALGAT